MAIGIKNWSVLVYMAADVTSEAMRKAAITNLNQMASVGSSEDVSIAAQIDLYKEPTRRYIFPGKSSPSYQPQTMKNIDSASSQALEDFLN